MVVLRLLVRMVRVLILNPIFYLYFHVILGWRIEGSLPDIPKMIIAAAPHTSNMDTVVLLWVAGRLGIKPNWLGKESLFRTPIIGKLSLAFGGIPVDRDAPLKAMKQTIAAVKERDEIILGIAPDGTRKYTDHWKKGFYYIAYKTGVPLVFVRLDYGTKRVVIREPFYPTGDMEVDLEVIRPFYEGVQGRYPEHASLIQVEPRKQRVTSD